MQIKKEKKTNAKDKYLIKWLFAIALDCKVWSNITLSTFISYGHPSRNFHRLIEERTQRRSEHINW